MFEFSWDAIFSSIADIAHFNSSGSKSDLWKTKTLKISPFSLKGLAKK